MVSRGSAKIKIIERFRAIFSFILEKGHRTSRIASKNSSPLTSVLFHFRDTGEPPYSPEGKENTGGSPVYTGSPVYRWATCMQVNLLIQVKQPVFRSIIPLRNTKYR
jgi:hypothetical protein